MSLFQKELAVRPDIYGRHASYFSEQSYACLAFAVMQLSDYKFTGEHSSAGVMEH